MAKYRVYLTTGTGPNPMGQTPPDAITRDIEADDVAYDAMGNLVFFKKKSVVASPGQPAMVAITTVRQWVMFDELPALN